jgi:hypothetical protein
MPPLEEESFSDEERAALWMFHSAAPNQGLGSAIRPPSNLPMGVAGPAHIRANSRALSRRLAVIDVVSMPARCVRFGSDLDRNFAINTGN